MKNLEWETATALDHLQGIEAQVVHRHYLGGFSHEQTALELGLSVEQSRQIAYNGLRHMKEEVFGVKKRGLR